MVLVSPECNTAMYLKIPALPQPKLTALKTWIPEVSCKSRYESSDSGTSQKGIQMFSKTLHITDDSSLYITTKTEISG